MAWLPLEVLKNMTVRTTPITVVTRSTQDESRENVADSKLESASGNVSLVWTLRKWPSELHKRDPRRKSKPPAALLGDASCLRPN